MKLTPHTIAALAAHLEQAELNATAVPKITDNHPDMDWDDAYAIQDLIRAAKAARGVPVAGLKMGLTSAAKIQQMGVKEPIYGFLNGDHEFRSGADIATDQLIHPKVEAEIGFVLNRPLSGPGCHIGDVLAATAYVVAAVEVIDSRYEHFKFDLKSVIADNTSAARYVLGTSYHDAVGLDLRNLGIVLRKNGEVAATASGAAVLGHPAASVAMLANMLGARGREIPAGVLIMTGGATEAIRVEAGDRVAVDYQWLGSVSMQFT
ncbi:2-oxo-3-hexenedioate decarboxylase [Duganella radicis]|uniref:2-oxo-3-hexenedioate decarboxylase n=1 Tax=Duganella radicis TaxID=551988 RepID=A0A6L6PDQ2_9BURK|nr:2-oxo-3-hexenedioate decarboxylase [Duganella radicis]MTV37196.1 2-oxo-3-hexenedioate decarboxylase [Duganella radicis]